jgi:hypothetical protein
MLHCDNSGAANNFSYDTGPSTGFTGCQSVGVRLFTIGLLMQRPISAYSAAMPEARLDIRG